VVGAVYRPDSVIVPDAAVPPAVVLTNHTGFAIGAPFTLPVNCTVCPGNSSAAEGVTTTAGAEMLAVRPAKLPALHPESKTIAIRNPLASEIFGLSDFKLFPF